MPHYIYKRICPEWSTTTAYDKLVNQIHATLQAGNWVASKLAVDMTGALIRSYQFDSLMTWKTNLYSNGLLDSFPHYFLTYRQAFVVLVSLSFHFCLSKAFPKVLLFPPWVISFINHIFLIFAAPWITLLLVFDMLMMQMFWLVGRVLRIAVLF